MRPPSYERKLKEKLTEYFNASDVRYDDHSLEVIGSRSKRLRIAPEVYSPMPDIAVGPFATDARYEEAYDTLVESSKTLIKECLNLSNQNLHTRNLDLLCIDGYKSFVDRDQASNYNARCLFAVEIEGSNSAKHFLGDIVNASAFGRVSLLVGVDDAAVDTFLRLLNYLKYLGQRRKPAFVIRNVLVLSSKQLDEVFAKLL